MLKCPNLKNDCVSVILVSACPSGNQVYAVLPHPRCSQTHPDKTSKAGVWVTGGSQEKGIYWPIQPYMCSNLRHYGDIFSRFYLFSFVLYKWNSWLNSVFKTLDNYSLHLSKSWFFFSQKIRKWRYLSDIVNHNSQEIRFISIFLS